MNMTDARKNTKADLVAWIGGHDHNLELFFEPKTLRAILSAIVCGMLISLDDIPRARKHCSEIGDVSLGEGAHRGTVKM